MKRNIKDITRIYNSVAEFSAALAGPFNESLFGNSWQRASVTGSESFTGTPDYESADHLLNYGDSGSLEKMQAVRVRKNAGQGTEIRRRQVNSVVGYAPNVPNYLRGVPVSMIGQNRVRVQSSKVVSIVYNFTVHCGVSEETIINESVKLLSVIGSMEKAGYRAGLSVMFSATKGAERYNIIVKVKDPGQYMDLRKLAYILVNPSFLRRHCFRAMETEQELREPWNHGYGGVTEGDICKDIVKGTPAIKDSKYIGFDDLLNRTPEEIEKSLLS